MIPAVEMRIEKNVGFKKIKKKKSLPSKTDISELQRKRKKSENKMNENLFSTGTQVSINSS